MNKLTIEQESVLNNEDKNLIVSASAGSGKTFVLIEYITKLVVEKKVPVKRLLVLTFTRAAAGEMRERLNKALLQQKYSNFLLQQLDDLSIADISTIDAFCEKVVKRNIDKLDLDENFTLLEDASEIKSKAFEKALTELGNENAKKLNEIYYSYRKNKSVIFETIMGLESFFSAMHNADEKINYFTYNQQELFEKALSNANDLLVEDLNDLKMLIQETKEKVAAETKYLRYCDYLINVLNQDISSNFINNVNNLKMIGLEPIPIIRGEERDEELCDIMKGLRGEVSNFLDDLGKYIFTDSILLQKQQNGTLAQALLQLYLVYQKQYEALKKAYDVVDFVDIENYALMLMQDEEVLSQMQEKYDYVFVDEYQDTNRVQEAIIKPITKNSHFVAVGDPKQGIYGFRNATMEIMQQDIADFSSSSDGGVSFLRGNFRSDDRVLSFINTIFEKVMTEDTVGLDYSKTSMLKGEVPFEKMELPSVRVDIVQKEPEEKSDKPKGIYSVKDDNLTVSEKDKLEIDTIVARIDEMLMGKIYDAKLKAFRSVEFDDIAVLFRSRNTLMEGLATKLAERGYPVLVDTKQLVVQDGDVQMLLNLLRLLLNKDNDVALISVLNSSLGGFTVDELASLRINCPQEKAFYDVLKANLDNEKVAGFYNMLDKIKLHAQTNGIFAALSELFVEKSYYFYLKSQGKTKYMLVSSFMRELKDKDFDISGAISYFEQTGGKKRSINDSTSSAIKLMTIHASKGLEYPIVILAGAGQKLEKPSRKSYEVNSTYGIGTYAYNESTNVKCTTPVLEMIKRQNRRKEMIDEIMIFYVALTRAKNHLYIVGQDKLNNLYFHSSPLKAKNYLQMIFYSFGDKLLNELKVQEQKTMNDWEFNLVTKMEGAVSQENVTFTREISNSDIAILNDYLDFKYSGFDNCKINLKNSVTGLNALHQPVEKLNIDESADYLSTGNAYHEALKLVDFNKVNDAESLNKELQLHAQKFTEGYLQLIDREILLKNILIIKNLVGNKRIFKEKQFVMSAKVSEVSNINCDDELLIQGIVDLFALGDENYLIDYKFTQNNSKEKILEKYSKQLDLYTQAIEKAFNIKINKKYILSLKNAQLIEYFN